MRAGSRFVVDDRDALLLAPGLGGWWLALRSSLDACR